MTKRLRPLDPQDFREPMRSVIRWHLLITEADTLATEAGVGLALVWGHIRRNNYTAARNALDVVQQLETEKQRLGLEQDPLIEVSP